MLVAILVLLSIRARACDLEARLDTDCDAIGAITREVAAKDKFLMRQQVLWRRRLGDGELGRVDVLYLLADRYISMNAVRSLGPTSQRRAERCYRRTEGATGQGREQSRRPLRKHCEVCSASGESGAGRKVGAGGGFEDDNYFGLQDRS